MIVELISTGSELLLGDTINTNAAWLAREFNRLGYSVTHQTTIGDNSQRMCDSFIAAAGRADIVVSTGGLGPTQGDITRDSLAKAVGSELVENEMARCEVEEFFKKRKREVPPASEREMMALPDSTILHNSCGVAPGIAYYDGASTPSPRLKGTSGLIELGWSHNVGKARSTYQQIGVTGWFGRERGITAHANFGWVF